jgi:glucokinase
MRIGVDLGGTNIAAGIVSDGGKVLAKKSLPTRQERGHAAVLADITRLCKELADESPAPVRHVGIGCPGTVNSADGIVLLAPNAGLRNIPISHEISRLLNIPVLVDNDANCAALGEAKFGAARGSQNSITVTLGTGIGGGIVIGGKIYTGTFFGAGEIGHQIIRVGGNVCGCGRRGCWEAYASAASLIRKARQWTHRIAASRIAEMAEGDTDKITAKIIFDAAGEGDGLAREIVDEYVNDLCIGMGNLINIFQPDVMVIGGGVSGHGQGLIDAIECRMPDMVFAGNVVTKFVIAELGNDAGIVGAACLNE